MGIYLYLLFRWGFKYSTFWFESVRWETESWLWDKGDKGAARGPFGGPSILARPQILDGFWLTHGAGHMRGFSLLPWRLLPWCKLRLPPGRPPCMSWAMFSTYLRWCKSRVLPRYQNCTSKTGNTGVWSAKKYFDAFYSEKFCIPTLHRTPFSSHNFSFLSYWGSFWFIPTWSLQNFAKDYF